MFSFLFILFSIKSFEKNFFITVLIAVLFEDKIMYCLEYLIVEHTL